ILLSRSGRGAASGASRRCAAASSGCARAVRPRSSARAPRRRLPSAIALGCSVRHFACRRNDRGAGYDRSAGAPARMKVNVKAIKTALAERGLLLGVRGEIPDVVTGIADDSRKVSAGNAFIAIHGWSTDGHDFLDAAAKRGAIVAIVEDPSRTNLPTLAVREGRRAAALASAIAYGEPARSLRLLGVTGTNGKTTTTSIMRHIFDDGNASSASIGTLGILVGSDSEILAGGSGLTTPGPVELQRVLRALANRGVRTVAMEVSSHSLDQRRIDGLEFDVAVFTNLTRDHLDYHGTMESYLKAKALLLDYLKRGGTAVINA